MEFWFEMLNELRESGTMNMFGAPKWLQENFELSKAESREIVTAWMETF